MVGLQQTSSQARVRAVLPGGQRVEGRLAEQRQGSGGDWFCLVELTVWVHGRKDGVDVARPAPVMLTVAAEHIERLEGEEYVSIPTYGHSPVRSDEGSGAAAARGKRVPVFRMQYLPGAGPSIAHVDGCSVLPRAHHDQIPPEELDVALSDPDREAYIALCEVCQPERVLTRDQGSRGEDR